MRSQRVISLAVCGMMLMAAGCRKTNHVDKSAFKSAINDYYGSRQECVWRSPVKFPAQADASNDEQTKGFDAPGRCGVADEKGRGEEAVFDRVKTSERL